MLFAGHCIQADCSLWTGRLPHMQAGTYAWVCMYGWMYMYACAYMYTFAGGLCCTAALLQLGCIAGVVLCCHRCPVLPVLCCTAAVNAVLPLFCCFAIVVMPFHYHAPCLFMWRCLRHAIGPLSLNMPPCLTQCFLFAAWATYLLVASPSILFILPHGLLSCLLYVELG